MTFLSRAPIGSHVLTCMLASLVAVSYGQSLPNLENGPYSSGILQAHALAAGKIHPASRVFVEPENPLAITCDPGPCVFSNSQASQGTKPVNDAPIAVNPNNPLQLITGGNDYNCGSIQGYYTSNDGGSTWLHSCGMPLKGLYGLGDPIVAYDLNNTVYRGGLNANSQGFPTYSYVVVSSSTDNGEHWSAPVKAVPNRLGGMADKPWMAIDTNPNSSHKNTIYVSTTQFNSVGDISYISVSRSTNGGKTWTANSVDKEQHDPPNVDQFSDLAIGSDGTVYVSWMRCQATGPTGDCGGSTATMYVSKSTNGGKTWSTPVGADQVELAPDTCGAFYGCLPNTNERVSNIPVIAIDASGGAHNGQLYLIDYTWTGSYMMVQVTSSTDGGATWSAPLGVAPPSVEHDQFFPWISVSSSGWVGATWLDRRNDPANIDYDAYGAGSEDFGETYPNQKLSAKISNPNNDGMGGYYMGDYTGNTWAGGNLYASWMDTSNGVVSVDMVGGLEP